VKLNRIFLDAGVLVAFCGCFYLLTLFVSQLDGKDVDDKDFSVNRIEADLTLKNEDWAAANASFQKLVDDDPYNGRATFILATSHYMLALEAMKKREELKKTGEETNFEELDQTIQENTEKSKEVYLRARGFARYRNGALLRLAVMECRQDNEEAAMEHLSDFVNHEGHTQYGLDKYTEFGRGGKSMASPGTEPVVDAKLHRSPRFWELVRKEATNR
jgi:hypothetical protein